MSPAQLGLDWDAPRRNRTAAREALTPRKAEQDRRSILMVIKFGPLTDAQIQSQTGIHPNAIRARRGELVTRGQVVPVGSTIGSSGRRVTLWGIAP